MEDRSSADTVDTARRCSRPRRGHVLLAGLLLGSIPGRTGPGRDDQFDWQRDVIVLKDGREERGVVIEDCAPEQVVLLLDGGRRREFPRDEVVRVDKLRDRLTSLLGVRKPGLTAEQEWLLVEDAVRARLPHLARVQAYRVLLLDPLHEQAHEFL